MRIVRLGENFTCERGLVSVGAFDGVHRAHQEIIRLLVDEQSRNCGTVCVATFDPHPQEILHARPGGVKLLTTIDERLELLEQYGVDVVVVLKFSNEFSQIPPAQFVTDLIVGKLHAVNVVVGHDHGFGKGRSGDLNLLRTLGTRYNFFVHIVQALIVDGEPVSSSRIRKALETKNIPEANALLGRTYAVHGVVVHGDARGSAIGFPTANLALESRNKLLPGNGVYAVRVRHAGDTYHGVMNIGVRPTLAEGLEQSLEVHILNYTGTLYGETIVIEFVRHIREEMKFESLEALSRQIQHDVAAAQRILA